MSILGKWNCCNKVDFIIAASVNQRVHNGTKRAAEEKKDCDRKVAARDFQDGGIIGKDTKDWIREQTDDSGEHSFTSSPSIALSQ